MLSLDVHLAVREHSNAEWVHQAIDSVLIAAQRAPYPVQLHVIPAVEGHIGRMRHIGYGRGVAPYVTYVDEDDYLLPEAFETIAQALSERPVAVFPRELELQNGYLRRGLTRHHLCVYDRRYLIDPRPFKACSDVAQVTAVQHLPCVEVDQPVYVHRLYADSSARVLRRSCPDEYTQSLNFDAGFASDTLNGVKP